MNKEGNSSSKLENPNLDKNINELPYIPLETAGDVNPLPYIPMGKTSKNIPLPQIPLEQPQQGSPLPEKPAEQPKQENQLPEIPVEQSKQETPIPEIPVEQPSQDMIAAQTVEVQKNPELRPLNQEENVLNQQSVNQEPELLNSPTTNEFNSSLLDNKTSMNPSNKSKKKSKKLMFIIVGAIIALIIIGVISIMLFTKKDDNKVVEMEEEVSNDYEEKVDDSQVSLICSKELEDGSKESLNLNFDVENTSFMSVDYTKSVKYDDFIVVQNEMIDLQNQLKEKNIDAKIIQGEDNSTIELTYTLTSKEYSKNFDIKVSNYDGAKTEFEKIGYTCK